MGRPGTVGRKSVQMKQWRVRAAHEAAARRLQQEMEIAPAFARLLAARGFDSAAAAQSFLSEETEFAPLRFAGMREAVERIHRALDDFESIAVYGDYDADGVTSTAMLYSYLDSCGANVSYYIPDREAEGYGMNRSAIDRLHERGVSLLITVDNGIASIDEIAYAASLHMDVVVTDHHRPRPELPAACAVVDPHRPGCGSLYKDLAGVGVAFELILALEGEGCDVQGLLDNYADLLSIGTIGDVVPLTGENRAFVRAGLRQLSQTDRLGLRELISLAGMEDRSFTATNVAFTIVPRINATGRMGSPDRAVRLLLSEDEEEAQSLAAEICADNDRRRAIEDEILASALEQLRREPDRLFDRVLIVSGAHWHEGVIGIVASRLTERFGKPCFVFSQDGDTAKASGRSVEGFDLFQAVSACSELLLKYGGHPMAAGLTLPADQLEVFRSRINAFAAAQPKAVPTILLDCVAELSELTLDLPRAAAFFEPFGTGNPPPLYGVTGVTLENITPVGGGKHLRLTVSKNGCTATCMRFGVTPEEFPYRPGDRLDLAVSLEERNYLGNASLSMQARELRPAGTHAAELIQSREDYETLRRGQPLSGRAKKELLPTRENFAALYRLLRAQGGFSGDTAVLWLRMGSALPLGRLLLCVDVLAERGLADCLLEGDFLRVRLLPAKGKTDLFSSPLLGGLNGTV